MKSRFRSMYAGQAIAIVMVILVVAAVLGASLYSRVLKNNQDVTDKEDSDIALEQADNLLDILTTYIPFDRLSDISRGNPEYTSISSLENANSIDLPDEVLSKINWCEEGEEASPSSLKITLGRTSHDEKIEVRVGSSRTFNFGIINLGGLTNPQLNLYVEPVDAYSLFTIKKVYANGDEVKDYGEMDMEAYCVGSVQSCDPVSSGASPATSIAVKNPSTDMPINVSLAGVRVGTDTYPINQVKVIPIKGNIRVSYTTTNLTDIPDNIMSYVKINAAVNCNGSYREKQLIFPSRESLGYSTIFDYTIYNNGVLRPS